MIVQQGTVFWLAAASSLILAGVVLARRRPERTHWSFALGMLGFVVEGVAWFMLGTRTETPEAHLWWLRVAAVSGQLLPIPWIVFVITLYRRLGTRLNTGWTIGIAASFACALAGASAHLVTSGFDLFDAPGPLYAAHLSAVGRAATAGALLATVAILAGLEACMRVSREASRWRLKYLVVGLAGVFLVRFYALSQELLYQVIMVDYLTIEAGMLFLGNLLIGASLLRDRLTQADVSVSRYVAYRSVVVAVLGLYLFAVGVLGWLLNHLALGEQLFWGSLLLFVSALGLAVTLLSENLRWRIKRFIDLHFYRSKYDYRQEWSSFTKRLGSGLTLEELAPQLLSAVTEAVGTTKGLLFLESGSDGHYRLASARDVDPPLRSLGPDSPLVRRLQQEATPLLLRNGDGKPSEFLLAPELADAFGDGGAAVPLRWRGTLTGLALLGPEKTRMPYTPEDVEFLATVGEQVAGAIVTARLSETLAQAREFEAFHRLTSFVMHDLKNSISALSMLTQNAMANFDDPEFQRDAIKTLARTVDRMKALLARLASTPEPLALRFQPLDLPALLREATVSLAASPQVCLVRELGSVPPVSGDPDALLRVFQNLVTNAVEALDGTGTVTVKTYAEGEWVVVSVRDTGCGISEDFLRRSLFAPLRSTKKGGWGIGLYQAKGIIEGHRGRIEVASREGEGTTFWVRLPLTPPRTERGES